jgi:hypothetical protein
MSSSNCSKDIVGFDEIPRNPDIMSLYIADFNYSNVIC